MTERLSKYTSPAALMMLRKLKTFTKSDTPKVRALRPGLDLENGSGLEAIDLRIRRVGRTSCPSDGEPHGEGEIEQNDGPRQLGHVDTQKCLDHNDLPVLDGGTGDGGSSGQDSYGRQSSVGECPEGPNRRDNDTHVGRELQETRLTRSSGVGERRGWLYAGGECWGVGGEEKEKEVGKRC